MMNTAYDVYDTIEALLPHQRPHLHLVREPLSNATKKKGKFTSMQWKVILSVDVTP